MYSSILRYGSSGLKLKNLNRVAAQFTSVSEADASSYEESKNRTLQVTTRPHDLDFLSPLYGLHEKERPVRPLKPIVPKDPIVAEHNSTRDVSIGAPNLLSPSVLFSEEQLDLIQSKFSPRLSASSPSKEGDISVSLFDGGLSRDGIKKAIGDLSDVDVKKAAETYSYTLQSNPLIKFAVIPLSGKQYKVTPGDIINTVRVPHAVGEAIEVIPYLVGSSSKTIIGRPEVPQAKVVLQIYSHEYDEKVITFKKNRRKRYQRFKGHRQPVSRVLVKDIVCDVDQY